MAADDTELVVVLLSVELDGILNDSPNVGEICSVITECVLDVWGRVDEVDTTVVALVDGILKYFSNVGEICSVTTECVLDVWGIVDEVDTIMSAVHGGILNDSPNVGEICSVTTECVLEVWGIEDRGDTVMVAVTGTGKPTLDMVDTQPTAELDTDDVCTVTVGCKDILPAILTPGSPEADIGKL